MYDDDSKIDGGAGGGAGGGGTAPGSNYLQRMRKLWDYNNYGDYGRKMNRAFSKYETDPFKRGGTEPQYALVTSDGSLVSLGYANKDPLLEQYMARKMSGKGGEKVISASDPQWAALKESPAWEAEKQKLVNNQYGWLGSQMGVEARDVMPMMGDLASSGLLSGQKVGDAMTAANAQRGTVQFRPSIGAASAMRKSINQQAGWGRSLLDSLRNKSYRRYP